MSEASWNNAVAAIMPSQFMEDLARSVANDSSVDTSSRWLLCQLGGDEPLRAFDRYCLAIEAVGRAWPVMRLASDMFGADIGQIARFVAGRIKAAMDEQVGLPHIDSDGELCPGWFAPATITLVLADRAHDIAAFFSIGLKPSGSKDPFALRRAAKHFIVAASMLEAER